MVKVIELSLEERTEREQRERLVTLAKDMFPLYHVAPDTGGIFISRDGDPALSLFYLSERVKAWRPDFLDEAIHFAEACEKILGKELTVKKEY